MNDIVTAQDLTRRMTVGELKGHVALVQQAMQSVMISGQDFDTIPGTDKPTLLQPGAQKLSLLFGFAPQYRVDMRELGGGHREYQIVCTLTHRSTGNVVGEGVGCCTTMENKYRYRWERTGDKVPKEYWDTRDAALLGGPDYTPRKNDGVWYVFHRVEHDNPADYYNTALKMGKKRAYVDATLTATAASHLLSQDEEDRETPADGESKRREMRQPQRKSAAKAADAPAAADAGSNGDPGAPLKQGQMRLIFAKLKDASLSDADLKAAFKVESMSDFKRSQINDILEWIKNPADAGASA